MTPYIHVCTMYVVEINVMCTRVSRLHFILHNSQVTRIQLQITDTPEPLKIENTTINKNSFTLERLKGCLGAPICHIVY